jgi:uncharacterized protein YndB with AHSA1/START domain
MQVEKNGNENATKNQTTVERKSDRELVVTRTFNAPATIVFDAWTKPELLLRWWAPRSRGVKLITCEIDLRVGGKYRYVFGREGMKPFEFFGKYTHVERPTRLVWTDEEDAAGEGVSTATFAEKHGKTTLTLHVLFPSKETLDGAVKSGMEDGMRETFEQLEELVGASKAND